MDQQLPDWPTALVPQLSVDRPHLWQVSLSIATISENKFQELKATLSPDERAKADRFYDPLDGQRYIMARGTLRSILSQYLHLDPSRIKFTYTPQGKPVLDRAFLSGDQQVNVLNSIHSTARPNTQFPNIQFNLSHSQDLAVYGVMLDRPLGIDVEYLRPLKDALSLAKRWFTPKEYTEILHHPDPTTTFFRFWTAKEAYLKATGTGLSHLSRVEIFTRADGSLQLRELSTTSQKWSIVELAPSPSYVGALAILDNLTIPNYPEIIGFWGIS